MTASIIAIGNPGAGKSTILNSLAGELLFKSGVSFGAGLTEVLDEQENERGRFYDTPGLSDDTHREAAAKAISTALRKGGEFKIIFFVRLEAGRIVREDKATFKLVLESAPEIGNKYGIVTNKLPVIVAKQLQNPDKAAQLLTKLFASIPEENRCAQSSITYLTYREDADCIDNYFLDLNDLITLEGSYFSDFVYGQIETVQLTVGLANNIEIEDYDKTTKILEVLEKRMEEDKQMFMEQQRRMLELMEKAENDKKEVHAREKEKFEQQLELVKMQIEQKDREIEDARIDAKDSKHRERLQEEQLKNQHEYQMQEFQKQQIEVAAYRERNRVKLLKKNEKSCIVM